MSKVPKPEILEDHIDPSAVVIDAVEDGDHVNGEETFVVDDDHDDMRLDKLLTEWCPEFSRTRLKGLIEDGDVTIDGRVCEQASFKVSRGQKITLIVPEPVEANPQPEDIPLDVVYEDESLLVINKPVGLVVHPGAGHHTGTLVNALLFHCGDSLSGIGGVVRPGIVHRLDRDTSGLMVVAKSDVAHRGLSAQLADRSLSRTYFALVWKVPQVKGVVDKPIARHSTNRQRMVVPMMGGKDARTHYHRHQVFHDTVSLVQCDLETGRTHQIRVHMASIGHPLVGDPVYGLQKNAATSLLNRGGYTPEVRDEILTFPRQALHAAQIRFIHPVTEEEMTFDAEPPADFEHLVSLLDQ
jgi:23S rRNA pseudouridine1911/1915/1917 synthase